MKAKYLNARDYLYKLWAIYQPAFLASVGVALGFKCIAITQTLPLLLGVTLASTATTVGIVVILEGEKAMNNAIILGISTALYFLFGLYLYGVLGDATLAALNIALAIPTARIFISKIKRGRGIK